MSCSEHLSVDVQDFIGFFRLLLYNDFREMQAINKIILNYNWVFMNATQCMQDLG